MSKIYYCPKYPLHEDHQQFYGTIQVTNTVYIDPDGDCVDIVDGDTNHDPDEYYCCECNSSAIYGTPPSALEQLAKVTTDSETNE
jgi:hypothetical protein